MTDQVDNLPPFGSIVHEIGRNRFLEIGEKEFDHFVPEAIGSHIPVEYLYAMNAQIGVIMPQALTDLDRSVSSSRDLYPKLAEKLFGKAFGTQEEAAYAISYAQAVATVKIWNAQKSSLDELLKIVANTLKCPDTEVMDKLESLKNSTPVIGKLVNQMKQMQQTDKNLKGDAVAMYGMALDTKQRALAGDHILRRMTSLVGGEKPIKQALEDVPVYLEEYFSKPQNTARMVLLSKSTRK
jgi:hypothetical protein